MAARLCLAKFQARPDVESGRAFVGWRRGNCRQISQKRSFCPEGVSARGAGAKQSSVFCLLSRRALW